MASIYAQIPGASAGTGDLAGYYVYPCSTKVNVSMTFGGTAYSINSADFSRPADSSGSTCTGGSYFDLVLRSKSITNIASLLPSFLRSGR